MRVLLLLEIGTVVVLLLAVGLFVVVGVDRMLAVRDSYRQRLLSLAPHLAFLAVVLGLSSILRDISTEVSWVVGRNITGTIHAIEGDFVAQLQSVSTPVLDWFFTSAYVFGYIFLITFPLFAYLLLDDSRPFRVATLAYAFNYAIGMVCYTFLIAFGPRNYIPGDVNSLIYTTWTELEFVTTYVNANTNVFPSLHVSLSVTVLLLAWLTRETYPRWVVLAFPLAASVVIATMYLGLHWLIDVVAGVLLAFLSVWLATRVAARDHGESYITLAGRRLWTVAVRSVA
ncbi:MAG: phosphatase PAP2 family protein [Halovenus sp.]